VAAFSDVAPSKRVCLFCGDRPGSREHVLARWLIERSGFQKIAIEVGRKKGKAPVTDMRSHYLDALITKAVCGNCNNGWMSDLEGWCGKTLGMLFEEDWPKLADTVLEVGLTQNRQFTKWALKTAITMDSATPMKTVFDPATPRALYRGAISSGVMVNAAYIAEPCLAGRISRVFMTVGGGHPPRWQRHVDELAFNVLLQVNHFAVSVFRVSQHRVSYRSHHQGFPLRCYPAHDDPFKVDYRFRTLAEFDASRVVELE
jgi:hypothetical protein